MQINPFRAVKPNLKYITSADTFFSTVREEYPSYKKTGLFNRIGHEAIYVYEIKTEARSYKGIISCVDIQEYIDNNILKHENTLAPKEQQQIHLLVLREAQVKPILLAIKNNKKIDKFIEKNSKGEPNFTLSFDEEYSIHKFWEVGDWEEIQHLQNVFSKDVKSAYIADGHHRIAAQTTMYRREGIEENYDFRNILCAFFPAHDLQIWDYNRVVDALEDMSPMLFMAKLSAIFDIKVLKKLRKPKRKHEIVMVTKNEVYSLNWRKHVIKEYKDEAVLFDVKMLNEKVLHDILGVEDVRTDSRVRYVEGVAGPEKVRDKILKNENRVGFIMHAVSMRDFMHTSDEGMVLPPKSTWFEPRMKNGLIVRETK